MNEARLDWSNVLNLCSKARGRVKHLHFFMEKYCIDTKKVTSPSWGGADRFAYKRWIGKRKSPLSRAFLSEISISCHQILERPCPEHDPIQDKQQRQRPEHQPCRPIK